MVQKSGDYGGEPPEGLLYAVPARRLSDAEHWVKPGAGLVVEAVFAGGVPVAAGGWRFDARRGCITLSEPTCLPVTATLLYPDAP